LQIDVISPKLLVYTGINLGSLNPSYPIRKGNQPIEKMGCSISIMVTGVRPTASGGAMICCHVSSNGMTIPVDSVDCHRFLRVAQLVPRWVAPQAI